MLTKVQVGSIGVQRKFLSIFPATKEVSHSRYKHIHFMSLVTHRVAGLQPINQLGCKLC